jgi:cysteine desulfuration protein SufE
MSDISQYPEKLREIMEIFEEVSEAERIEILLDYSDRFSEVPKTIAVRPFPEENRVQRCESEAYVFTEPLTEDNTLKFHFAVENPQGVSAKALGAILQESLSGGPIKDILNISEDIVIKMFGKRISMGKGEGLMGMISLLKYYAKQALNEQN